MKLSQQDNVVITPFSIYSILLYHRLKRQGIKVKAFFDRNSQLQNNDYDGIPVLLPIIQKNSKIIVCSERYESEIIKQLVDYAGNGEVISCKRIDTQFSNQDVAKDVLLDQYKVIVPNAAFLADGILKLKKLHRLANPPSAGEADNMPLPNMSRIILILTEKCTLKCKYCGTLNQYFEKPKDIDLSVLEDEFDIFIRTIDFVDEMHIIGGEPLLYPHLAEIIRYIYKHPLTNKKIGYVRIVTNGTLIPKDDVLAACKETETSILISNYAEYSRKIDELVSALEEWRVIYCVQGHNTWALTSQLCKPDRDIETLAFQHTTQCITSCRALKSGKFYHCSFLANADDLHAIPYSERNYVDLFASDFSREKLAIYLSKQYPPVGCAFCNGCSKEQWENDRIPEAEQCYEVIEYKKY